MSYSIKIKAKKTVFDSRDWFAGLTTICQKVVLLFDEALAEKKDAVIELTGDEMTIFQNLMCHYINIDDMFIRLCDSSLMSEIDFKYTRDDEGLESIIFRNRFGNEIFVQNKLYADYQDEN